MMNLIKRLTSAAVAIALLVAFASARIGYDGTRVTLDGNTQQVAPSTTMTRKLTIQADPDNVNPVYVGRSTLAGASTALMKLDGGQAVTFVISDFESDRNERMDVSTFYVRGTAAEFVYAFWEVRE